MPYAHIQDQQVSKYPLTEGDIKNLFPETSFTSPFSPPDGYVSVFSTSKPPINHTHNAIEGVPIFSEGKWVQTWDVVPASEDEIAVRTNIRAAQVKTERNQLLTESDWSQLLDAPVDKEGWAEYRQDLRDITDQPGFPWEVQWPDYPTA